MAMLLTPEQRADIDRQRREHPGRRIVISLTPEQEEERRHVREIELAGMVENKAHARKVLEALREDSFSGQLRRAIAASRRSRRELAERIGVDAEILEEFFAGEGELASHVIDRLAAELGLQLAAVGASPDS